MQEFLLSAILGVALIFVCGLITYELLRMLWKRLPDWKIPPRQRIALVIAAIFIGHIANIWIFAFVYFALIRTNMGEFSGAVIENGTYAADFFGCLYFSAVSYSTLGLGDVTPERALRMITGVESLTGFVLIGWTVSFTYLAMEKFWQDHP
jgi:hypothetical protein